MKHEKGCGDPYRLSERKCRGTQTRKGCSHIGLFVIRRSESTFLGKHSASRRVLRAGNFHAIHQESPICYRGKRTSTNTYLWRLVCRLTCRHGADWDAGAALPSDGAKDSRWLEAKSRDRLQIDILGRFDFLSREVVLLTSSSSWVYAIYQKMLWRMIRIFRSHEF